MSRGHYGDGGWDWRDTLAIAVMLTALALLFLLCSGV